MAPARPRQTASRKPVKKAPVAVKSSRPAATPVSRSRQSLELNGSAARRKSSDSAADSVDEQLARYRSMRDFKITAEPSGTGKTSERSAAARTAPKRAKASAGLPFVIQKHAASHLHYDFRLGWNGVLKSWAVAKGPSYYTGDRRLAVQVEDHPMEYGGFEGIIPKGQYGGGTVMVWDQGTWWPQPGHENVDAGLRAGSLKFEMSGTKMHGKWTLVRMGGRAANESKPNWLLIKEHDPYERSANDVPVTEELPNSAVTGRTMEQIAHQSDHVWNSKETAGTGRAWYRRKADDVAPGENGSKSAAAKKTISNKKLDIALGRDLEKLPKEKQPEFLPPQLALEAENPPEGKNWLHEIKLDGYRMQARKSGSRVQMLTRSGLDWTHRMRAVAAAIAALPVKDATFDGEVVVLKEDGTSSFANLQASFQSGERHPLTFFCFDLLHLDGRNTRDLPLRERKELLAKLLDANSANPDDTLRLSEHLTGEGAAIFRKACELHTEGIVSKLADAPYRAGRSAEWLKSKCLHEQEFVIGGYTLSSDGPDRVGSLLLGYYDSAEENSTSKQLSQQLIYAGRSGTGFTQKMRRELRAQLGKLDRAKPSFIRLPAEARRDALWVEPKLVAQVRFATWTADDLVRQAAFLGLREDKKPQEVTRGGPEIAPQPKSSERESGRRPARLASHTTAAHRGASTSVAAKIAKQTTPPPTSSKTKPSVSKTAVPVRLTHPDKILDPESGLTKRQLAEYYWAVAERMLPHIADRPLSLVRCPEGAGKPCFFQKHVNHMLPPGIGGIDVPNKKTGVPEPYITLNTSEALAGLAQMGVLEVHPWGSRNEDLEHPDRIIFDLDPDEAIDWPTLCSAAAEVRKRLKRAGLESFLKTTGGKGLHIVAPIQPQLAWPEVKDATHNFVLAMERDNPALYLTKMTKAARKGKIYLDYLRNERGATAVAPFSPRARVGAPVSLPLPWSALKLPERPRFAVTGFDAWKARLRSDPWKAMLSMKQRLDAAAMAR